ncbi:T9SS type A sorting domain-containing protein [Fulvivirga sp. M361]|uniref:alginate lyase family protein n=1 Tax=Fulvivirga sp. M361 TaxID=2594266 RepID=UPI00117A222F|nr:alginate lyase family protein [Fulvivirga sp. M361]TRX61208.1 T9SS type A sorting domain-containing protein [Fulvivirga sp. M361]
MRGVIVVILVFLVALSARAQYPDAPEPWREEYNFSLAGFEFKHPMTVLNSGELELIKKRISLSVEPQASAYLALIAEADGYLNFVPNAPVTLDIPGGYQDSNGLNAARELLWSNCHPAYTTALAYALTGNIAYAEKAREVLMNWTQTETTFTGDDRGLQLGSYFTPMLYAADLIYDYSGWTGTERDQFHLWWRTECLEKGEVIHVMRGKDNNWKDAGLLGVFAAAVAFEDHDLLNEALIQLKSYFYSRTDKNVRLPGAGWKIESDDNGVYLPREVVRNDGRSGLTYTAYALTTMVQCFEIARYAGFDLWNDTTEKGVQIIDVINQYFIWERNPSSFPWGVPNLTTKRRNHYEIANSFLEADHGITNLLQTERPIRGREGDAFSTLNKGGMKGRDTVRVATPVLTTVEALTSSKIKLEWLDQSDNEYGFILERKTDTDFEPIGQLSQNSVEWTDESAIANTDYQYRLGAYNAHQDTVYSETLAVTTPAEPIEAPARPSGFTGVAVSSTRAQLTWSNTTQEEGYELERLEGDSFIRIAILDVNDTTFTDTGLSKSSTYTYRLKAFNGVGASAYTETVNITTFAIGAVYEPDEGVLVMEAENGEMGNRWDILSRAEASMGKVIEVNPDFNSSGDEPGCVQEVCIVRYNFQLETSGNYSFWFRLYALSGEEDSFFWRIDDGDWVKENGRSGAGAWFKTDNAQVNEISAGFHVLEVAYRENGTQLDKFIIQLDTKPDPFEEGPTESGSAQLLPPLTPENLTLVLKDSTTIIVSWSDVSDNETGYILERQTGEDFVEIAQLAPNTVTYEDTGLSLNTNYTYRISTFNLAGSSGFSAIDSLSTPKKREPDVIQSLEKLHSQVHIYPNPSQGLINLHWTVNTQLNFHIRLYDIYGKDVFYNKPSKGQIDFSGNPDGVYYLHISSEFYSIIQKLILFN